MSVVFFSRCHLCKWRKQFDHGEPVILGYWNGARAGVEPTSGPAKKLDRSSIKALVVGEWGETYPRGFEPFLETRRDFLRVGLKIDLVVNEKSRILKSMTRAKDLRNVAYYFRERGTESCLTCLQALTKGET